MLIYSRYLLSTYFKVLLLSVASFIAILLISRLEEIAHFATMGCKPSYLIRFILFQIPYILPIAFPVSCLISSTILFQRLSQTHELTAFRSLGISIGKILSPVLWAAFLLTLFTFYMASEMATSSHLAARKMIHDLSSVNPFLLLQNGKIAKLQGAFVQMKPVHHGKSAKDVIVVVQSDRLHLAIAKKVALKGNSLYAENVSLISSVAREPQDHLVIENQKSITSSAEELSKMVCKGGWKIANDYLKLSLLKIRFSDLKQGLKEEKNPHVRSKLYRNHEKCKSEFVRRLSMAVATFTFTLMGASFGMEISRNNSKRGLIFSLLLGSIALISFFIAKEFDHLFWLATLLFLMPHLIISLFSIRTLAKINKGIE